jgi:hypothetical protein
VMTPYVTGEMTARLGTDRDTRTRQL